MKKLLLLGTVCLFFLVSFGQKNDTLFFENLVIPNTPAISLMDQNPTIIETPETGKALILSIINSVQSNKGIPQNYAVEFTPFWYFKYKNMNSYKYARIDPVEMKQKYFFDPSKISISIATLNITDTIMNQLNSNISFGVKFNLITIRRKSDIQDFATSNNDLIHFMKEREDSSTEYMNKNHRGLLVTDKQKYNLLLSQFIDNYPVRYGIKDSIKNIINRKPIFSMDGAIAYSGFFINNNFKDYHFGRFGAWVTMRYSNHLGKDLFKNNYFNLYAIGRYIMDGTLKQNGNYIKENAFDIGGKAEIEIQKIAFSFEYVYRIHPTDPSFRACGNVKYKLSDKLVFNCAFGRNFGNYNNVVAIMGINWGFNTGLENMSIK